MIANSRSIKPSSDVDVLNIAGDIADPATSDRIVLEGLARFGRIDTLINNAGIFISKPFVDYTEEDYTAIVAINLGGFFRLTKRVTAEMLKQGSGHIVQITTTLVDHSNSSVPAGLAAMTKGGLNAATRSLAMIRFAQYQGQRCVPWCHQDADACGGNARVSDEAASARQDGRAAGHR